MAALCRTGILLDSLYAFCEHNNTDKTKVMVFTRPKVRLKNVLIKVAKSVYFGMKKYTSLPDLVSVEIDDINLNCLYN